MRSADSLPGSHRGEADRKRREEREAASVNGRWQDRTDANAVPANLFAPAWPRAVKRPVMRRKIGARDAVEPPFFQAKL